MRLTSSLCKYVPEWYHMNKSSASFFKKQSLFFMTRYYKNIGWSTHKNAMNRYQYFLKYELYWKPKLSAAKRDINRARIAAACDEHGFSYSHLMSTLPKLDINLNLASLARLAIYEPRTFRSLVDISRDATSDNLPPANFNPNRL